MGSGSVCLETASEPLDPDAGSAGEVSGLLVVFFNLVECCFRNRASAGRGRRAGRLGCLVASDVSETHRRSTLSEEFWDLIGEVPPSEPLVLALSLWLDELKMCFSSLAFLLFSKTSVFLFSALTDKPSL